MKSIFSSKVFWLAIIQGAVAVWAVLATQYPTLGWVVLGKSVLDVILRYFTTEPVSVIGN